MAEIDHPRAPPPKPTRLTPSPTPVTITLLQGPVIQAGQSLSDPLDCRAGAILRMIMPSAWTSANITFQTSTDGTNFHDLVDNWGKEVMLPLVTGTVIVVSEAIPYLDLVPWLRIRSGSRDAPLPQQAQRAFQLVIDTGAPITVV